MISPAHTSRRAFTLIELLVVIAILGVLMTLLFPAVQGALETAKKTQAKNDVVQIVTAITGYVAEYGRMPATGASDANKEGLWDTLSGKDTATNPRGIVFMEVPNAKSGKNGRAASGSTQGGPYLDSWGNAYVIMLDDDYDNKVKGPDGSDITKTVVAWSTANGAEVKKYIKSWE